MINLKSIEAVKASTWTDDFCKPLYASYCFSKIAGTLLHLFGLDGDPLPDDCWREGPYDSVVLFVIDGFGWQFLEKHHAKYPFLSRFFREGLVSKLTSQFPSTTAAHITSLCSGLEVGQTGIYEWFYYEPKLDRVIAPLLYSYAGDKKTGTLEGVLDPSEILPAKTLFQKLRQKKITSVIFQPEEISHSPYSNWMFRGAEVFGYRQFPEALDKVLARIPEGGFFYVYFGDIDSQAHRHGVDSDEVEKTLDHCFKALEKFWQKLIKMDQKTACLVTADHGMTSIDPQTTLFVNREISGFEKFLQKGADGRPLTPSGSCRDYFMHIIPAKLGEAKAALEKALKGKALICETSELIKEGFFGAEKVSKNFLERIGNLVVLPYGNNSIWWFEKGRFDQKFYAMHGGLTREELETIFLFLEK